MDRIGWQQGRGVAQVVMIVLVIFTVVRGANEGLLRTPNERDVTSVLYSHTMTWPRIIAIAGTSNLGKTTLAGAVAATLSWPLISTDKLARHPGRPWTAAEGDLPVHVIAHYEQHSPTSLTDQQIEHFHRMEPLVAEAITRALEAHPDGVIVEGSAVLPSARAAWMADAHLILLVGSAGFIWDRIRHESGYATQPVLAQKRIERFRDRSVLYQERVLADLEDGSCILELTEDIPVADLVKSVLARACSRRWASGERLNCSRWSQIDRANVFVAE